MSTKSESAAAITLVSLALGSLLSFSPLIAHAAGDGEMPQQTDSKVMLVQGKERVDGEALRLFSKARQCESDGTFAEAQNLYEQVVEAEPTYIYAWSNLGNVLVAQGNLDQALLCYRKAISLAPPRDTLSTILLNMASTELSLGKTEAAIRDLSYAEKIGGGKPEILTTRAVALTNNGQWDEGVAVFEKVFSSAERNALPWWLRYSMALLEVGRGTEGVAYLQRTLNRFPDESECKAFAVALYSSLGSKPEAARYWRQMTPADRKLFVIPSYTVDQLHWGPKANKAFSSFIASPYAVLKDSSDGESVLSISEQNKNDAGLPDSYFLKPFSQTTMK